LPAKLSLFFCAKTGLIKIIPIMNGSIFFMVYLKFMVR
jgi:hypothetical protein